jgi:nucleoid-associated protein YgaU
VVVAGGACAAFLWAGRFAPVPVRWSDLSGWLGEVEREDAFVEVARWVGVGVSGYVCASASLALLAEVATAVRLVPVARILTRVGRLVAVPMLRQRLWRSVSTVAVSASTMVMATPGAAAAGVATPVEVTLDGPSTVDDPLLLPQELVGSFSGFGLDSVNTSSPPQGAPAAAKTIERVVVRGDTVWDLSKDVYGRVDGAIVNIVANANDLNDPSLIFAGQRLVFPPLSAGAETPQPATPPGDASWATHTVVAGDTLWEILESHYGWVSADLVWHVAEVNDLENPSMIAIGTVLTLPSLAEDGNEVTADQPPAVEPSPAVVEPSPTSSPPTTPASPAAPSTTVPVTAPNAPATSPLPPPTTTVGTPPAADDHVTDEVSGSEQSGDVGLFDISTRTLWWQVPMGLLLAAGLATMARRLRGRRAAHMRPGEQLARPPQAAAGTELAVNTFAPPQRIATLQALLRAVTPHAREQHDPPAVRVVELSDDRIEVLFSAAAPFPPEGWSTVNGGRSWVHALTGPTSSAVQQLVTPALVTLGRRVDGGEVLLDLESAGALALTGDRPTSIGVARSMVLELATYPLGVPIDVCLIGIEVDGVEHCDRVWSNTTLTRAVRVAREALERTTATGAVSLVSARAATDEDTGELDPQVFVVDLATVADSERRLADELVDLCQPQSGAAVILIGEHERAVETLDARTADLAVWSGAALIPPVVAREAAAQVAVMFDHLANAPAEPMTVSPVIADTLTNPAVVNEHDPTADAESLSATDVGPDVVEFVYDPPPYEVLVRCLGEVTVEGRDITQASEVELLTLLTLQRDTRPNIDTIYTLLVDDPFATHGKRPVPKEPLRPMQQRVSRLRVKLGTDANGDDLLPAAKAGRGSPSRYSVSARVLTDVELLEHRYHTSFELSSEEAFDLLRDGLATFRGPMMRARKGYSWATTEGITSRIGTFVIAYAVRLMELAFERNDIPTVLETVRCCGLVLDDPLVELQAWQRIDRFADTSAHPDLVAAVHEAHRRLASYVDETDPVADTGG